MTVLGCLRCRTILTCRPPEARARRYSFPHADDFAGCDICGALFCAECSQAIDHHDAGQIVRAELEHYAGIIHD